MVKSESHTNHSSPDLGAFHVMQVLNESFGIMEASMETSKEGLRGKAMCNRIRTPASSPGEGNA
jgi:hypothetical protein